MRWALGETLVPETPEEKRLVEAMVMSASRTPEYSVPRVMGDRATMLPFIEQCSAGIAIAATRDGKPPEVVLQDVFAAGILIGYALALVDAKADSPEEP